MKTVFFDIDTQIDFLFPAGALYVPGAERLVPTLARLNRYAAGHGIPVVSTMDAHAENDPEFRAWPPHCVAGTVGQQKPCETVVATPVIVSTVPGSFAIDGAGQIVVEKQALDLFTNPNLEAVLERLAADSYVVYGVVTEYCVRCAVMGLLRLGKPVELVTDAVETLSRTDSHRTLREFAEAGGRLVTIAEILTRV